MAAVNLLPSDISPKGPVVKISNLIKSLAIISFVTFLVLALGMVVFFILNSAALKSVNLSSDQLKTSIKTLEETEQGLVLVRDRITKAKQVLDAESGLLETESLGKITASIPLDVSLSEAVISKDLLDVTFVATNSQGLAALMAQIISEESFAKIELVSFSFNPNAGYVPSFSLKEK
ncbi:MAG: hypothetical protein AAB875_02855 [Patescibacteria group bacterium]